MKRATKEIEPDEIFIDASNLPSFDTDRFEGRIEQPIGTRSIVFLAALFFLVGSLFVGKLYALQIVAGGAMRERSENNRLAHTIIFADRGIIEDRTGIELAGNEQGEEVFPRRVYVFFDGLSHALGYAKAPAKDAAGFYYQEEYTGIAGIEKIFDAELKGMNGLKITETDAQGTLVSESVIEPPRKGARVVLSLDATLTNRLHGAIRERAETVGFRGGSGLIMDIRTGELLALTNYPEYDSQLLSDGTDAATIRAYVTKESKPFLNRATAGLFTPGSIVKPFLAAGALVEGVIDPEKELYSSGALTLPNPYNPAKPTIFPDWKAHGYVDMRRAIAVSSNVYFFQVGGGFLSQRGLGIANIEKYVRLFGFGTPAGLAGFSEEAGVIPTPAWKAAHFPDDPWRIGDTYNTSIGQYSFQVTPLQAVRAAGGLASGMLVTPVIRKGAQGEITALPIEPRHLKVIREGMRQGVTLGTARALDVPYVDMAAKTGTAELDASKRYVNSWVIGFFPYENPRYAFALLLEHGPYKNLYGAPSVMTQVFEWMHANAPWYLKGEDAPLESGRGDS